MNTGKKCLKKTSVRKPVFDSSDGGTGKELMSRMSVTQV